MLQPKRYAVLDAIISDGLGFALNVKGYTFFMRLLRDFVNENKRTENVATVEAGIFDLIRQQVRAQHRS